MNYLMGFCLGTFLVVTCYAESSRPTLPHNLVKLTKENNPKCVEYIMYKNEMYCSITPLEKATVDPKILSYEKVKIQFDARPWKAAWGKNVNGISTVEYVPFGDDINDWKELITSQFLPNLIHVTPAQFQKSFLDGLDKAGITYTSHIIENKADELIFEFKVQKPENLQQDEILKIKAEPNGLYIIHYAIKNSDMNKENRKKWVENLKKSTLK